MGDKILGIAPHPDDETLGCGGTLLKHKNNGDVIYWMIVTNMQPGDGWSESKVQKRKKEIDQVSAMYGFEKTFNLGFPTRRLDSIPYNELIAKISDIIKELEPSIVYLPNRSDIHTDHKKTFNAVMSSCKDFRASFIKRILMYECLSETEFAPAHTECVFIANVFIDVSEYFQRKLEILKAYASEVMASPFPRSIETVTSLARYRGSRIGKDYAEAFYLLFEKNI